MGTCARRQFYYCKQGRRLSELGPCSRSTTEGDLASDWECADSDGRHPDARQRVTAKDFFAGPYGSPFESAGLKSRFNARAFQDAVLKFRSVRPRTRSRPNRVCRSTPARNHRPHRRWGSLQDLRQGSPFRAQQYQFKDFAMLLLRAAMAFRSTLLERPERIIRFDTCGFEHLNQYRYHWPAHTSRSVTRQPGFGAVHVL